MPIVVIDTEDLATMLQQAVVTAIAPLQTQLQALQLKSDGKDFLTIKEFAERCRLNPQTVNDYCNTGRISFSQTKERGKILIPVTELLKFKQC